ncbi:MAG: nitrogenase component 1 [Elusimicrobiota bacterium]
MSEGISEFLGLKELIPTSWRVVSAVRQGKVVRLGLSDGKGKAGIVIRPRTPEGGFIRAGRLELCYEGRSAPDSVLELLRRLAPRVRGLSLERLPGIEEKVDRRDPDSQCISDRLGGNPGQWRRFLCGKEFHRQFHWAHATGFADRILYLTHGDFDCTFMPPDMTFRGMTFLNYPPLHPHCTQSRLPDTVYEQRTTDLKEKDVVMGTAAKLRAVERAVRRRKGSVDGIMISWSCTPTVIGDDETAMAEKLRRMTGLPVAMNSINFRMQESFSLFEEFFRHVRAQPGFMRHALRRTRAQRLPKGHGAVPHPRYGLVNLVDCPKTYHDEELAPLLASRGLRVNARVFPDIRLNELERYLEASVQVIPEHLKGMKTLERALGGLPLRTVYAPAPYGLEDTRAYVRSIGGALPSLDPGWEPLRREAGRHRLAFVLSPEDLPVFEQPGFQTGVPVPKMLREMGFKADVLLYGRDFKEPQELAALLRRGPWKAVYSDIFFDSRLTRAGKAQFSMRMFEPGFKGALRTLERLLDACRLPFYPRYSRYLNV